MATITSTIKLVDQMTPTLNKINRAIDNTNKKSKALNNAKTWSNFNVGAMSATRSVNKLYNALRRTVFILGSLRGLKEFITVADTMMNATARLDNINDGLYTTAQYLDMIYASAQRSRGSFSDMVTQVSKIGTVAGDAFGGNVSYMVAFAELLNKSFRIAGASASESSNAAYQLTQALAAGRLQGDEMRSILENAPLLAQAIAKELGVTVGELKALGAEGEITADVILKALFGAADEIEAKFANLPKTIGDVWTEIKNHAINEFRPVIDRVQDFINSPTFEKFKNKALDAITKVSDAVIWMFDQFDRPDVKTALSGISSLIGDLGSIAWSAAKHVISSIQWMCSNWEMLDDAIYAVTTVLLGYKVALEAVTIVQSIYNAVCFITEKRLWKIIGIVALVLLIVGLVIKVINSLCGTTINLLDVIAGAVAFVAALIWAIVVSVVVVVAGAIAELCQLVEYAAQGIANIFLGVVEFFKQLAPLIPEMLRYIWECAKIIFSNLKIGICETFTEIGLRINAFRLNAVAMFWEIVYGAVVAFNDLIQGSNDVCVKMLTPFASFANSVKTMFNSLKEIWNGFVDMLSTGVTIPDWIKAVANFLGFEVGDTFSIGGLGRFNIDDTPITAEGWIDQATGLENTVANKLVWATAAANAAKDEAANHVVNWSTEDVPSFKEYLGALDPNLLEDYNNRLEKINDAFHTYEIGDEWETIKNIEETCWGILGNVWGNLKDWPVAAYNGMGEFRNKMEEIMPSLGSFLDSLFNGDLESLFADTENPLLNDDYNKKLPSSMEDLLDTGAYDPSGDILDAIADNTGSAAGSAANIEDTLNLAEEELELLRKLAEQEVINRFTTAEIKVDMTNNNNVNSNMDLDGIVTHLSNKLYEELGVVASGVHY